MGSKRTRLMAVHIVLLVLFIISAFIAVALWLTADALEEAGIAATIAVFWATASAFVERIAPMDGCMLPSRLERHHPIQPAQHTASANQVLQE